MLKVTRYSDGDPKTITLEDGANTVAIDAQRNGGWLIQTNFNDFYEQRAKLEGALGVAASMLVEVSL